MNFSSRNISPHYLKAGDLAGIIAPAGIVETEDIEPAIGILEQWGLKILKGNHLFGKYNFFAGTDEQRLEDLQDMLDNTAVRVIFCARGGYGLIRILEKLDFSKFLKSPKWVVGYSDITMLHVCFHKKLRCESLHAIMPKNFKRGEEDGKSLKLLHDALFGEKLTYGIEGNPLNRPGNITGQIIGGNLAIISSLQATSYEIDTQNKILFIEDVGEYIYRIERMLINLKMSGKLSKLKGLIVGGMTDIQNTTPGFGKNVYEVISDLIEEYGYPVIFGFPAGHMFPNLPIIMGRNTEINVTGNNVTIRFSNTL